MEKLIRACKKQTPTWPADGQKVIYARVYTHLDDYHVDKEDAAPYVGQTIHAAQRDAEHRRLIQRRQPRETRQSHYDIALRSLEKDRHVLILACHNTFGFGDAGISAQHILEQTAILVLRSYANWLGDPDMENMTASAQQSRFLTKIDRDVREETGFQPDWRPARGTNVRSPLFETINDGAQQDFLGKPARVMQAIHVKPTHPADCGFTSFKIAQFVRRTAAKKLNLRGQKTRDISYRYGIDVYGTRTDHNTPPNFTFASQNITVPNFLGDAIAKSVGKDDPKDNGFIAMLVFELMDDDKSHPYPYYRFPTIGPYHDDTGLNSLGLRLQWRSAGSSKQWYTARFGTPQPHAMKILTNLANGNPSTFENKFQQVTALIQMLRAQYCVSPSPGFYRDIRIGHSRPMIQTLELDHLRQTAEWRTSMLSDVAPCRRTTEEENAIRLANVADWLIPGGNVNVGYPDGGRKDPSLRLDELSLRSAATSGATCDTCKIRKIRTLGRQTGAVSRAACDYDKDTKSCLMCRTMNRKCTFSSLTLLVEAWVGDLDYDKTKYHGKEGHTHLVPMVGQGRMATMLPHTVFDGESFPVEEVGEPWGWRYLYTGAEDEAQEADEFAVKVEEGEEEGEEDGEK
jgi:hypothetical protein